MSLVFLIISVINVVSNAQQMEFWLTDPDAKVFFQQQPSISPNSDNDVANDVITINENVKYQTIDGFGYTLTGGSAMHLYNLDNTTRARILQELFAVDQNNIGVSYLRLSIGSSVLNEAVFSYDDLP